MKVTVGSREDNMLTSCDVSLPSPHFFSCLQAVEEKGEATGRPGGESSILSGQPGSLGQDGNIQRKDYDTGDSTADGLEFLRAAEGFETLRQNLGEGPGQGLPGAP